MYDTEKRASRTRVCNLYGRTLEFGLEYAVPRYALIHRFASVFACW